MRDGTKSIATLVVIVAALLATPMFGSRSTIVVATEFCSVLAIALMWNVLASFAGIVLIGMPVFIGAGGYTLYVVANWLGIAPYPVVIVSALASGLLALALAPILFRLQGAQLAIGSWVLSEIAAILVLQSQALGGGGGLNLEVMRLVPRASRLIDNYACAASVLVIALVVILALMRSRLGMALRALRDSEPAAEASGVETARVRLIVLIVSAALTGAAGGVYYISSLQITPGSAFSVNWMAIVIFVVILGGIGSVEGPIVGAVAYFVLREALSDWGSIYFIAIGLIAIGVTIAAPKGLWGLIRKVIKTDLLPIGIQPAPRATAGRASKERP